MITTLEYLHLAEWMLHPERSELAALALFALSTRQGVLAGALALLGLLGAIIREIVEGKAMDHQEREQEHDVYRPPQPAHTPPLDLAGAVFPKNVIELLRDELLREGITVKVSIEFTPPRA